MEHSMLPTEALGFSTGQCAIIHFSICLSELWALTVVRVDALPTGFLKFMLPQKGSTSRGIRRAYFEGSHFWRGPSLQSF